jgi:hypothetical protein
MRLLFVFGQVVFWVIENSVNYRMNYYDDDGNVLDSSGTLKFLCTNALCAINFPVNSQRKNKLHYPNRASDPNKRRKDL